MTDPIRVLLVEDSTTDAKLVIQELRATGRTVEYERVQTADAMRRVLKSKAWDIVISDWSMPQFSAPAALAVLKEHDLDLPFIIVSGTIGEEAAVEAMRAGARDYVLKDKLVRLAPAVERELGERKERVARRQAEEALRASEARFRRLAESGIIGIVISEVGGRIVDANDAYVKMVGYTREELRDGRVGWMDLTPPEFRHLADRAMNQLRQSGVASPWETESLCKGGGRVPVLVGLAMLEHPQAIAFAADLTERKAAEAARMLAEAALHDKEEQLRHAQKMDAVGRLAGGVAHDFNNVLSVILSYAEVLSEELKVDDPVRSDIEQIHLAASKAAALTRQLLTFSRQEIVEPKVIDLHEVLTGMEKMLQCLLGENVEVSVTSKDCTGRVKVDPSHIEQLIMNLVVNARDAMPLGGKLVIETVDVVLDEDFVTSHPAAKAGPYVVMSMRDNGIGMDRETKARIFEPFFTTKEKGKGTGLGLSTVFGITHQSGGFISVESQQGHGTTFKVYLPKVAANGTAPTMEVGQGSAPARGVETILLVEDEEQVRAVAVSALRRQGYTVIPAKDPTEAILLCERHRHKIDLLLTDVVMPQMSGPELAKRLTSILPAMKILCMSGCTDDSMVRRRVVEIGIAFLQKPVTPALLARKVREVLDGVTGLA
jgi:two-component system cell cycle sensor histidine kinase/response regulator CckA